MTHQKWLKFSIVMLLGITLPLMVTLILAWSGSQSLAQAPSTAPPAPPHKIGIGPMVKPVSPAGEDSDLAKAAAAVERTTVAVFESYQPLLTVTLVASDTWVGPLVTPFTYQLSGLAPDQLRDLFFAFEGGGSVPSKLTMIFSAPVPLMTFRSRSGPTIPPRFLGQTSC